MEDVALNRFKGEEGRRRLVQALVSQTVVLGNVAAAEAIADACELIALPANQVFIEQDAWESDVFLILTGSVGIEVNGVQVATRPLGTHIGEMAAIDPTQPRSATVRTLESTVLAKVSEPALSKLAAAYPELWRRFAVELAVRLRQRRRFIRVPNERPLLFIGSASERLAIAQAIQAGLAHDNMIVQVWTDDVFQASEHTLSSLIEVAENSDFGVFVLGADDIVKRRGKKLTVPRDNAVFELGLFVGAVGRNRTYIVKPRGQSVALPTDLLGITPIEYNPEGDDRTLAARMGPVCTHLRGLVSSLGVK